MTVAVDQSPVNHTQTQLIARDYAAMGFTRWMCNTCALPHSNEWVADPDNGPHCDNCGADLFPQKSALGAVAMHILEKGKKFNDFTLLEVTSDLEFIAHTDGVDVWRAGRVTQLTEQLALEWCAFLGIEVSE